MKKKFISIVLPTFNRSQLIERAVTSIFKQTNRNWELIIVDDGSTDDTENVVKEFLIDERVHYIKKENSGAAHSRNIGVEKASYDYITFLDSDDEAKPEWLSSIAAEIETSSPDMICCGCEIVDHKGTLQSVNLPHSKPELFGNLEYKMTNGGVFVLKKDLFHKVGGYDAKLRSGQHTELSFRLIPYILENNGQIKNISQSLIIIHIHLGERIRGNTKAKYLGSKRTLNKHLIFFKKRPLAKSLYAAVVAHNAYLLENKKDAIKFSLISFKANPSLKGFLRIAKYSVA